MALPPGLTADAARDTLAAIQARVRTLLPPEYQDIYDRIEPVPMGSAGLRYQADGEVAWHLMWQSFCDLAMAGGPPHKGSLLEPPAAADITAERERYDEVVWQICRGITMVTDLQARAAESPGWIRVSCFTDAMAAWLTRAVTMENVSARLDGRAIELPAGPGFRIEKEIKNVITVMAKTCHYWVEHTPREQQAAIAALLAEMDAAAPLVTPIHAHDGVAVEAVDALATAAAALIAREAGLRRAGARYAGWLGVECESVGRAVWMMRAAVACNMLARREGTVLFVPVNPRLDPEGRRVAETVALVARLAVP